MDPGGLTALRAQIVAATVAALAATAQDKIEAEESRDLIAEYLAIVNILISQLTATRTTNTVPTVSKFSLTPGKMSPDLILNYSTKTDIIIYEKAMTPFKLTFDGAISNIKIFVDDIMQRENDTGWYKGQGDIIHVPVDGTPMNVVTYYGCVSMDQIRTHARSWINREVRQSQNNQMMVKIILDSISKTVRQKITNQEAVISVGTP